MISKYYATFDVKLSNKTNNVSSDALSYIGIYIEITTNASGVITGMRELYLDRNVLNDANYSKATNIASPTNLGSSSSDTIQDYINNNYTAYRTLENIPANATIAMDADGVHKFNGTTYSVGVLSLAHKLNGSKIFSNTTSACNVVFEQGKALAVNTVNGELKYNITTTVPTGVANPPTIQITSEIELSFTPNIISSRIPSLNKVNLLINKLVAADSISPINPIQSYNNIQGWYYKNSANQTAGNGATTGDAVKCINWYVVTPPNMKVSDLKGIYLTLFNGISVTKNRMPFITVYTIPTATDNVAPGFYKSKRTFIFDSNPTQQTHYTFFINKLKSTNTETYMENIVGNLMLSSMATTSNGNFGDDEMIGSIVIGSDSGAATDTIEFIVRTIGIIKSDNKINEYVFKSTSSITSLPTGYSTRLNLYDTNNSNRFQIVADAKQLRNTNNIIDCFELKTVDTLSLTTSGIYSGNLYTNRADNTIVNVGTELNTLKIHIAYLEGIITTLLNQAVPTNGNNALPPL